MKICKICNNKKCSAWRQKNKEHVQQYNKEIWPELYAKKSAYYMAKARLRKLGLQQAAPKWLEKTHWKEIQGFYTEARETKQSVDHIVPLNGKTVCGLHVPWNLQVLALTDNLSKGRKFVN